MTNAIATRNCPRCDGYIQLVRDTTGNETYAVCTSCGRYPPTQPADASMDNYHERRPAVATALRSKPVRRQPSRGNHRMTSKPAQSLLPAPTSIATLSIEDATKIATSLRWPQGVRCANCSSQQIKTTPSGKPLPYLCRSCHKYFSVKTNTFLNRSLDIRAWLAIISNTASRRQLPDQLQLDRAAGVNNPTTAAKAHKALSEALKASHVNLRTDPPDQVAHRLLNTPSASSRARSPEPPSCADNVAFTNAHEIEPSNPPEPSTPPRDDATVATTPVDPPDNTPIDLEPQRTGSPLPETKLHSEGAETTKAAETTEGAETTAAPDQLSDTDPITTLDSDDPEAAAAPDVADPEDTDPTPSAATKSQAPPIPPEPPAEPTPAEPTTTEPTTTGSQQPPEDFIEPLSADAPNDADSQEDQDPQAPSHEEQQLPAAPTASQILANHHEALDFLKGLDQDSLAHIAAAIALLREPDRPADPTANPVADPATAGHLPADDLPAAEDSNGNSPAADSAGTQDPTADPYDNPAPPAAPQDSKPQVQASPKARCATSGPVGAAIYSSGPHWA